MLLNIIGIVLTHKKKKKKNVIMDRHTFDTAVQKPGESVQAFVSVTVMFC